MTGGAPVEVWEVVEASSAAALAEEPLPWENGPLVKRQRKDADDILVVSTFAL